MAAAGLALAAAPLIASAEVFTFSNEFSESGDACANSSCATLTVVQNGANVDFTLALNLASGEFVTGLFGNIEPFQAFSSLLGASNFTAAGTTTIIDDCPTRNDQACKPDGDGYFDYVLDWGNGDFTGTESISWTLNDIALSELIGTVSEGGDDPNKTGFVFALRVQGLGDNNEGSGWFSGVPRDDTPELPEPGSLALLGLGLMGLVVARRRRT